MFKTFCNCRCQHGHLILSGYFYLSVLLAVTPFSALSEEKPEAEKSEKSMMEASDIVEVYIPKSQEVQKIKLNKNQQAIVYVFLSSLGDPLDSFMVSLASDSDNKLFGSVISGPAGEVRFNKVPPGRYTVFVNRRVKEGGEYSSVVVGDVRLRAYP